MSFETALYNFFGKFVFFEVPIFTLLQIFWNVKTINIRANKNIAHMDKL